MLEFGMADKCGEITKWRKHKRGADLSPNPSPGKRGEPTCAHARRSSPSLWEGVRGRSCCNSRTAVPAEMALVMEQPDAVGRHHHAVFVRGGYYDVVAVGSTGLSDVFDSAAARAIDAVSEREEGVRAE